MSEFEKKLMQTPDLNKERLEELKRLLPDLFTNEGKLNPDELKKIVDLELVKETERFEFKWFGKSEAKRCAFTPSKATLVYDSERSVNPEYANGNIIIEGENLESLKVLLSGYRDSIKCIYIDPPYNTGKDFVYSDKWDENKEDYWSHIGVTEDGIKVDTNAESSGRYHSNWLNMMYSRLLLARQLLRKDDGVIFISIDDNEIHHLRRICDDIFGEESLIGVFSWKNKYGAGAKTKGFIEVHEYVLCYSKNILIDIESELTKEQIEEYDKKRDEKYPTRGGYVTQPLMTKSLDDRDNLKYKIVNNGEEIQPRKQWVWEESRLLKAIQNNEVVFKKKKNGEYSVRAKIYLKDENGVIRKGKPISSLNGPFNQEGTEEVEELIGEDIFSFPKPKNLLRYFISFIINNKEDKNGIYLDFFAGSGTTAHAVMELNREDGGNRRFILVQIPELIDKESEAYKTGYKIISDITIERNKRVIQKIEKEELEKEEAEKQTSLLDSDKKSFKTGFKVYKLAKSNFPRVDFAPNPAKTEEENLALLDKYIVEKEAMFLATVDENNLFDEVLLKNGFMLNYSKNKVDAFSKNNFFQIKDDFKECLICLDISIAKESLKELEKFKDKMFICLERALDTTMKWNLKHLLGDKLIAF